MTIFLDAEQDGSLVDGYLSAEFPRRIDEPDELTDAEQLLIWSSFYAQAKPIADRLAIEVVLLDARASLAGQISLEEDELLRRFAVFRGISIEHPDDANRWYTFVVEAHRSGSSLTADELRDWLRTNGWRDELADTLARDYRHGRRLLRHFESCE